MQGIRGGNTVKILDREFELYIEEARILSRIREIASEMQRALSASNPVFLAVLNGAFFFASDLMKEIDFPCEISFVKVASYIGMASGEQLTTLIGLDENLKGRNVVVVEDIVDTGRTMWELVRQVQSAGAASIRIATLILKPQALKHEVPLDYVGFEVENAFLVGYGLDYNKQGRNFKDILIVKD